MDQFSGGTRPLPEAADYHVQIRQKQRETRTAVERASDWTRFDVTVDGTTERALFKREVVLRAVRQLIARGKAPQEILRVSERRNFFAVLEGQVDAVEAEAELARRKPNDPRAAKRYFCDDDQLIHADGKTYCVTTQWSGPTMIALIEAFEAAFGDYGFSYRPLESDTR